ncbi:sugar ABC transporter permease [Lachnoclostridium sp. An169]|uniref:carbohydrate ABC transporter permease n=1 Tax=Lachnoclostridium sp. An169 TaxID=1965569 RepID=UPI000B393F25|nr:carbohydrate ABC transporter permease [Lachnoclostridium sp. An169]OUP85477.1 sugar ABC transporter permease [Lachnoclostridium sp. An169]
MKTRDAFKWQVISHVVLMFFALCALIPFILLVAASFSDEVAVMTQGYSIIPKEFSLDAYTYIATRWADIGRSYLMTILVTLIGTGVSMIITSMFAYTLSMDFVPGVKILNFLCIFTMLFSGGVVGSYYIWSNVFHIRDTIWGLILPNLMMNAFNVILVKNYYVNSIPASLREAARIDGCSEIGIFWKIAMPLSIPINATIGLMTGLAYWNDWTNGLYYLTERNGSQYYTIQLLLNRISENIQWLSTAAQGAGVTTANIPTTTSRMAIGVIGLIPVLIVYPFLQKYFVKGITVGAVKE